MFHLIPGPSVLSLRDEVVYSYNPQPTNHSADLVFNTCVGTHIWIKNDIRTEIR